MTPLVATHAVELWLMDLNCAWGHFRMTERSGHGDQDIALAQYVEAVNELHGTGDPRVSTIMASHRKWIDSNFIVGESNRAADLVELFNSKRGKQ